jgi:hypothetical protein
VKKIRCGSELKSDDATFEFLGHASCRIAQQAVHTNETLMLATQRLRERNPEAGPLFALVAHRYDVREAWLGAAVAYHLDGNVSEARSALAQALCRYAHRIVPNLVGDITAVAGAYGWAVLYSSGRIVVRLQRRVTGARPPTVNLDDSPLALRADANDGFAAQLPADWRRRAQLKISAEYGEILGGVIRLKEIARIEGFADTLLGNLQGWVWCPNDPEHDPVLSIVPTVGGVALSLTAAGPADARIEIPLARPRGFEVPAHRLRSFEGPVRVVAENGQELRGSPLDPSMERRSAAAAATAVAKLFPAPGCEPETPAAPVMLAVPARVTGRPAMASHRKRQVDVVIPVFGALELTLACLDSVLADLPVWARVHVVDDASPDPKVGEALRRLAGQERVTLSTQPGKPGVPRQRQRWDASRSGARRVAAEQRHAGAARLAGEPARGSLFGTQHRHSDTAFE